MLGIFVNYRRSDSLSMAHLLLEQLRKEADCDVFVDQDGVELGPYPEQLDAELRDRPILLALIGPTWETELLRRADAAMGTVDWVVRELETAIRAEKFIVPALIDGAAIPQESSLPLVLRRLLRYQAATISTATASTDIERLLGKLRQRDRAGTLRSRKPEQEGYAAVRLLISNIRQLAQERRVDLALLSRDASADHAGRRGYDEDRPLTQEQRERFEHADAFATLLFYQPSGVWTVLESATGRRVSQAVTNGMALERIKFSLRFDLAGSYEFQNVDRVFQVATQLMYEDGARLVDGWHEPERILVRRPAEATEILVAKPSERESLVLLWRAGANLSTLGTYRARRLPLRAPRLRATPEDEIKLYACDQRSIYRWHLDEATPEADWPLPDDDVNVAWQHLTVLSSPRFEFAAGTDDGRRWLKRVGEPTLIPISHGLAFQSRMRFEPSGRGGQLFEVAVDSSDDREETGTLLVTLTDLDRPADSPVMKFDLRIPFGIHDHLLARHGDVRKAGRAYGPTPATFLGSRCVLVKRVLFPTGDAIYFVDAETGHSMRTPVVLQYSVGAMRLLNVGKKHYLVCGRGGEAGLEIFDVSNVYETGSPPCVLEWGRPIAVVHLMGPDRGQAPWLLFARTMGLRTDHPSENLLAEIRLRDTPELSVLVADPSLPYVSDALSIDR